MWNEIVRLWQNNYYRITNISLSFLFSCLILGETGQREWCTLAYWELGGRVGRLYPVEPSTVNVFDSLHDGDGLCLATLAENHNAPPVVQRTRSKIGLGKLFRVLGVGICLRKHAWFLFFFYFILKIGSQRVLKCRKGWKIFSLNHCLVFIWL